MFWILVLIWLAILVATIYMVKQKDIEIYPKIIAIMLFFLVSFSLLKMIWKSTLSIIS